MSRRLGGFSTALVCGVLAAVLACAASAAAQTTLRWKFKKGEKFDLKIAQESTSVSKLQGMEHKLTSKMTWYGKWDIADVKSGATEIMQTINRVTVNWDEPGGSTTFDSADAEKETTDLLTQQISDAVQGFVHSKLTMDLSPRGALQSAVLDEASRKKFAAARLKNVGSILSSAIPPQMVEQMSCVFPERPVSKGDSWENEFEVQFPPLGAAKVKCTYTYDGSESRGGRTLDLIRCKGEWQLDAMKVPHSPFKLSGQSFSGDILFDNGAGRFVKSTITQKLTMEAAIGDGKLAKEASTTTITTLEPIK